MDIQLSIFGAGAPAFDASFARARRQRLDAASWVEHVPGWLGGSDVLFRALVTTMSWRAERREMYERVVDVPRLTAWPPADGVAPPVVDEISAALNERYGESLGSVGLAYYRSGADSVAMHGDRLGKRVSDAVIAIVSLGTPRRFLLKPRAGGPSVGWSLGGGDLLVMGGACQRDWLHGVPKVAHAGPRISIQFRPGEHVRPSRGRTIPGDDARGRSRPDHHDYDKRNPACLPLPHRTNSSTSRASTRATRISARSCSTGGSR